MVGLNEVWGPPKETFECLLEIERVCETAGHLGLKFNEHVDIAALGIDARAFMPAASLLQLQTESLGGTSIATLFKGNKQRL